MHKNRVVVVILIIAILGMAGAAGYYYWTNSANASTSSSQPALQTATARRGDLTILASGTGQVIPDSQVSLAFSESGTILEMKVKTSDAVKKGDLLAQLQTKNTAESIASAKADAQVQIIKAQKALEDLKVNAAIAKTTAMNDVKTYAQAVRDAQYQIDLYTAPRELQDKGSMEGFEWAKAELDKARAAFEPYKYYPKSNEVRTQLLDTLNQAQSTYDSAIRRLDYEYQLEVAQANLEKAQQEYEKYKDGPAKEDELVAQADLNNAQAKLAVAEETQEVIELRAPVDGIVMDVTANVGEYVGTTAVITLAEMKEPLLQVYLDETDLDKLRVGTPAEVTFDAIPNQVYSGTVTQINPKLETVSNVNAIKVLVQLNQAAEAQPLPIGLSASVDVISGKAADAVLIPREALRELDPGEFAVFVIENGLPVVKVVKVGLMDLTTAQILSGVKSGDVVTTGIVGTR